MHIRFDGLDNVVKPGYGTIPTGVSLGDCATGMMGAPGSNKFLTRLLHPGLDHLLQIEGKRGEFHENSLRWKNSPFFLSDRQKKTLGRENFSSWHECKSVAVYNLLFLMTK
ncbi:hypothetical protein AXF15_05105 [Desulfomicrobium orale DSM 12838]|uniref:Uncharacterized protein n=1 Tax=Desulfomicrobium orale DSM 12838 TaxID=888061 RepID=A0A0X8JPE7_9BACT|nr:hypothetical protein AXF15_05105 [Desulfomicrobium orale DSM 12838]